MADLYEFRIWAAGEVRDADGNLIEQQPEQADDTPAEDPEETP